MLTQQVDKAELTDHFDYLYVKAAMLYFAHKQPN